jgi:hypothetical protein
MAEYRSVDPLIFNIISRANQRDYLVDSAKTRIVDISVDTIFTDFTVNKNQPAIYFTPLTAGDSTWYCGVNNNQDGTDDDSFVIGKGTVVGSNDSIEFEPDGDIKITGGDLTLDTGGDIVLNTNGQEIAFREGSKYFDIRYEVAGDTRTFSMIHNWILGNPVLNIIQYTGTNSAPITSQLKIAPNANMAIIFGGTGQVSTVGAGTSHFNQPIYILGTRRVDFYPNTTTQVIALRYSGGTSSVTGNIQVGPTSASNGLAFYAGSGTARMEIDSSGNAVWNESGADVDFRFESNSDTHLLFLDGGNDAIAVGTDTVKSGVLLTVDGHIGITSQNEVRFYDNGNYVGFEAPSLSADQIWVLPTADGSANDVLTTDGSGNLSWAGAGATVTTTRITNGDSPYNILSTDRVIYCDTDGGAITANLPAGSEGKNYKIINVGSSGNDVTVDPNGSEQLFGGGAGVSFSLGDAEIINIHYNSTEGWW